MDKIFAWAMQHNLNLIVEFHNALRGLMRKELVAINKELETSDDEDRKRKLIHTLHLVPSTFDRMLHNNTFLMMYSYLEEFLYHVPSVLDQKVPITGSGSIKRFKPVLTEVLKMDLGRDPDWQFLCDCEKVRNRLLHANGRIDISKDKDEFNQTIARLNNLLNVRVENLEITGELLDKFHTVANRFINTVESKTKT